MSPAAFVFPPKRPLFKRPEILFGGRSGHHQGPPTRLHSFLDLQVTKHDSGGIRCPARSIAFFSILESLVYHFFGQLWLVLGVKLMDINSNWFSRIIKYSSLLLLEFWNPLTPTNGPGLFLLRTRWFRILSSPKIQPTIITNPSIFAKITCFL